MPDKLAGYRENLSDDRRRFFALAELAVRSGILTERERDVICRPGTRKAGYWARHLRDLRSVLAERQAGHVNA